MGSLGLAWDAGDIVTASRMNQKTIFAGTGAQCTAATKYAGAIFMPSDANGSFSADIPAIIKSDGSTVEDILTKTATQSPTNKTIATDNNTIKDSTTNTAGDLLVNNGTKFVRKARGTADQVPQMNAAGTDIEFAKLDPENLNALTQTGRVSSNTFASANTTSYSDLSGITATITAKGGKSALVTIYSASVYNDTAGSTTTIAITDGSGTVIAERDFKHTNASTPIPVSIMAVESAPSAGSLTRKVRAKITGTGTALFNGSLLTGGQQFVVMEVV